ncbi:4Fe-4S dicluster domain-containing protein [bacterium]|nr:4Fe-4S dicluster domain-containing protein [bacterium]
MLSDRLNRFPQGVTSCKLLFKILKMLFSEKEARLVSLMPIKPFTAKTASIIWKINILEARKALDKLADRALMVDFEQNGEYFYVLPPPMAGFFEFAMMRVRDDIDQKVLSELLYEYLNVEEDFIKNLFTRGETQLGRVFVHEPVLSRDNALHVLDYERASEVIKTATHRAVGICYCRHKMHHLGRACKAPLEICMTFNNTAASLIRHEYLREVDTEECLDLLQEAYENNLVQFGENCRELVNFICNCCGCCCEAMRAARRFAILKPVHTTGFISSFNVSNCNGCGRCVSICPVDAIHLGSENEDGDTENKVAILDEERCLGCGLCARTCVNGCVNLIPRSTRIITPLNATHRVVVMAIERGMFQNLIFDNRVLWNHRALAAVLGVVLKLPPFKQIIASRQVKSRYMEALVRYLDV